MKGTKELKTNKGITLIALIITVIIMLILAGVTIDTVVNQDLFGYAKKAVEDTQGALDYEQQLVNDLIDEFIESNLPKITASKMKGNLRTYLGKKISYGVTYQDASSYGNGEWEIFYSDGEHIYIITRGHLASGLLTTTGYGGTSDFTEANLKSKYKAVAAGLLNKTYDPSTAEVKYTSTYDNMKATQYLLDSTVWASYANGYADWAIGAPTLELFVDSYNAFYLGNTVTLESPTDYGYSSDIIDSIPSGTYLNHSIDTYYWLAGPQYQRVQPCAPDMR